MRALRIALTDALFLKSTLAFVRIPNGQTPFLLIHNSGCVFLGTALQGKGFQLSLDEAKDLVDLVPNNDDCIFPYLGGSEVNSSPTQDFDRYVISFGDMSLEDAGRWPVLLQIVRDRVKPDRDKNNRETYKKFWWKAGEARPALYNAIAPLNRVVVTSRVQPHLAFSFQPTDRIFSDALCVFPLESFTALAILQSRVHEIWARLLSSTMKSDLRYSASDCFSTFPFPSKHPRDTIPEVSVAGKALYEARAKFMIDTDQGLTKTYNALKNPESDDERICELRQFHVEMDRAVLGAYGWADIEVPPYCPMNEEEKAAVKEFNDEVIDRLYVLNAVRAAEEKKQQKTTLDKPSKKSRSQKSKKKSTATKTLPGIEDT